MWWRGGGGGTHQLVYSCTQSHTRGSTAACPRDEAPTRLAWSHEQTHTPRGAPHTWLMSRCWLSRGSITPCIRSSMRMARNTNERENGKRCASPPTCRATTIHRPMRPCNGEHACNGTHRHRACTRRPAGRRRSCPVQLLRPLPPARNLVTANSSSVSRSPTGVQGQARSSKGRRGRVRSGAHGAQASRVLAASSVVGQQ